MPEREQIKKTAPARQDAEEVAETPATSEKGEALKAELDEDAVRNLYPHLHATRAKAGS